MAYKIISDKTFDEVFREITIFKYNLNHQEFISYVHDLRDNYVSKNIFDTVPRRKEVKKMSKIKTKIYLFHELSSYLPLLEGEEFDIKSDIKLKLKYDEAMIEWKKKSKEKSLTNIPGWR
jgi:hypothetical protein